MEKLVQAFMAADIPLHKLRNPHPVQLFADLGQSVPSESSYRNYVETSAENETERLRQLFENKNAFVVIDETELNKVKYVNVLIGDIAVSEKMYLLDCWEVETVNQQVIAAKIDDALRSINIPREKFVLLLSDAASYMTAATAALKTLYPNLFHVTCVAHMLHNCSEKIRAYYTDVDQLIAWTKAATVKNKTRRNKFEDIGMPPEPALTRWGTWLEAANYYAENLVQVRRIVNSFEGNGILVRKAKDAVNDEGVARSLTAIQRDYSNIPKMIKKVESSKYTMLEAYKDITKADFKSDSAGIMPYLKNESKKC